MPRRRALRREQLSGVLGDPGGVENLVGVSLLLLRVGAWAGTCAFGIPLLAPLAERPSLGRLLGHRQPPVLVGPMLRRCRPRCLGLPHPVRAPTRDPSCTRLEPVAPPPSPTFRRADPAARGG